MINSPTLSVLSSAPKAVKAPTVPVSNDARQSFGSAFDAANQSAQNKAPVERENIEKTQSNQELSSSDVNQKQATTEANRSEQGQQPSRHAETNKQSTSDASAESVSETDSNSDVTTDKAKSASSITEGEDTQGQENGKAWQAEGQSLAVDPEVVTAASSAPQIIAQASPDETLESPLESVLVNEAGVAVVEESIEASTDTLLSTEQIKSSASDIAKEIGDTSSDQFLTTGQVKSTASGTTKEISDTSSDLLLTEEQLKNSVSDEVKETNGTNESGEVVDDEILSVASEAELENPIATESAADKEEASATNEADSSTEVLESISVSLNDVNDSTITAPVKANESAETNTEDAAIAQSEVGIVTQMVSEQAAEAVKVGADAAQLRESRPVDLVAQDVPEQTDVESIDSKASDNLRWVMEQMSKKTAEPVGLNNALNQVSQDNDSLLESDFLGSLTDGELVLDSDKIELPKDISEMLGGKKTLDQLMANLGSQLQPAAAQANSQGALNALQSNPASARPEGAAAQLTMQSPPNATAFPSEMAAKVSWVAKEGFKTAHIHLDPPELGSLTVKISVDHESNAHVSFVASSAQAKDALEGQMQRLREMLQQQGVELDSVDVEVSQGNDQAFSSGQFANDDGQGGSAAGVGAGDDLVDGDELENVGYVSPAEQGIDYYA